MSRSEQGTALLEFCLVMPILLIFTLGILSFALYVIESHMLHFSAYVAARTALTDDPEVGERSAVGFLASSRLELFWLSPSSRQLSGADITVSKSKNRVEVGLGRERTWLSTLVGWMAGKPLDMSGNGRLEPLYDRLYVTYAMGRK